VPPPAGPVGVHQGPEAAVQRQPQHRGVRRVLSDSIWGAAAGREGPRGEAQGGAQAHAARGDNLQPGVGPA
jgi:hypothetical protein